MWLTYQIFLIAGIGGDPVWSARTVRSSVIHLPGAVGAWLGLARLSHESIAERLGVTDVSPITRQYSLAHRARGPQRLTNESLLNDWEELNSDPR